MKPWINAIVCAIWLVCLIPSLADAQALPPGVRRIVFHERRLVPFAYVPERTTGGTPIHWPGSCVFIRPHAAGTTHIEGDAEQTIIAEVLDHWRTSTQECGYLRFMLEPPEAGEVGLDYVNRIIFREDRWCQPATPTSAEVCHDPTFGAVTSLVYVDSPGDPNDGTILDADIEINAVNYAVGTCTFRGCVTMGTQPMAQDLANQLTHEIGHLLGLAHTCRSEFEPMGTDTDGSPVLFCTDPELPFEATTSSMYPVSIPEETRKATLSPGDVEDFCEIYPLADDPESCAPATPRDAGPPDAGPPTDAGPDASTGTDAGSDASTDSGRPDMGTADTGTPDLGTTPSDAGTMPVPDAAIQRDGTIHTVPFKDEGCACAVGQGPPRTPWTALLLLGLPVVASLLRRRRRNIL